MVVDYYWPLKCRELSQCSNGSSAMLECHKNLGLIRPNSDPVQIQTACAVSNPTKPCAIGDFRDIMRGVHKKGRLSRPFKGRSDQRGNLILVTLDFSTYYSTQKWRCFKDSWGRTKGLRWSKGGSLIASETEILLKSWPSWQLSSEHTAPLRILLSVH